jgi:hypothetical protein
MKIAIDPEFAGLLPERDITELEEQILAEGAIRDPLVVWECNGSKILLDGHRRQRIRDRHPSLPMPKPVVMEFETRDEAHDWVIDNQRNRRNCTPEEDRYLLGKKYLKNKPPRGKSATVADLQVRTKQEVAKSEGVSERTVHNAAQFAQAVDAVPELKAEVIDGKVKTSAADLKAVAALPPQAREKATERIKAGVPVKRAIAAAKPSTKPDAPAAAPEPPKDEWGAPIQEHAMEAFEAVSQFEEIIKLLRQANKLYKDLAEHEGGKLLQRSGISINTRSGFKHAGIANAIRDLKDCKPAYTICPYSVNEQQKHGKDCPLCHGLNWSPKFSKDRVPERLVEKAKAACST